MNRYPLWKYIVIAVALLTRRDVHAAELLRRIACGAGLVGQADGQGRHRADGARRVVLKDAKLETTGVFFDTVGAQFDGARALSTTPTCSCRPRTRCSRR